MGNRIHAHPANGKFTGRAFLSTRITGKKAEVRSLVFCAYILFFRGEAEIV